MPTLPCGKKYRLNPKYGGYDDTFLGCHDHCPEPDKDESNCPIFAKAWVQFEKELGVEATK